MTDWNKFVPRPAGTYACDLRRFRYGEVRFVPNGPVYVDGNGVDRIRHNPVKRQDTVPLTARLFVGLSVGQEPRYSIDDVVRITRRVRTQQGEAVDASFLFQRGLYTDRANEVVEEDSVQVVIFGFGISQEKFEKEMSELAETLLAELQQETIYVELQKAGVPYMVLEVTP